MIIDITCKTDRFNLSVVGHDFINDCCYGEDFSRWLVAELQKKQVDATVICMEDFGWINQVVIDNQVYLMSIAGTSDDNSQCLNYGQWHIMLEKKRSFLEVLLRRNPLTKSEPILIVLTDILTGEGFENISIVD